VVDLYRDLERDLEIELMSARVSVGIVFAVGVVDLMEGDDKGMILLERVLLMLCGDDGGDESRLFWICWSNRRERDSALETNSTTSVIL